MGDTIRFRLVRDDDLPATNPDNLTYLFGLQDKAGTLVAGSRDSRGKLRFDFTLTAKPGKDPDRPSFTGPFASGPADDRFVYLSWRAIDRGDWINRLKVRLSAINWELVRAAQAQCKAITADMSGRGPREATQSVTWFLD
jgi:hypothetical protein